MFFLGKVASNCDVRTLTCTTKACPGLETFFKKIQVFMIVVIWDVQHAQYSYLF